MSVIQLRQLWTCAALPALEVLHFDFLLAGSSLQAKAVHIMCKTQSFLHVELPTRPLHSARALCMLLQTII